MLLFDTLNRLGTKIQDKYEMINNGGCCVYASIVGRELVRRGVRTRILVAASYDNIDIREKKKKIQDIQNISEWNQNGIYFSHVGLSFQFGKSWFHYDTHGVKAPDGKLGSFVLYKGYLTVGEGVILASSDRGWNTSFDRDDIPAIDKKITKFFNKNIPITR